MFEWTFNFTQTSKNIRFVHFWIFLFKTAHCHICPEHLFDAIIIIKHAFPILQMKAVSVDRGCTLIYKKYLLIYWSFSLVCNAIFSSRDLLFYEQSVNL